MKGGLRRPCLAQQSPRAAIPASWNRATPGNPCLPPKVRASDMPVLRKAQSALSSVEKTVLSERRQPRWHRQWPVRIRFLTESERQLSNLLEKTHDASPGVSLPRGASQKRIAPQRPRRGDGRPAHIFLTRYLR